MSRPSSINLNTNLNTLIRAGAGAGKTTRLINEVYDYFVSFKRDTLIWPRLVLTTFSNKATQEINERLLKKAIEVDDLDFFEFISSNSHLFVSTIHGVLHFFINQNQSEFGLTKDFSIVSETEISSRQQKVFRRTIGEVSEVAGLLEVFSLSELFVLVKDYQIFRQTIGEMTIYSVEEFADYIATLRSEIKCEFLSAISTLKSAKLSESWSQCVQDFPSLLASDEEVIGHLYRWQEGIRQPSVPKKGDLEVINAQVHFVAGLKKLRDFCEKNYHESFLQNFLKIQKMFMDLAEEFIVRSKADRNLTQNIGISDIETLCSEALGAKQYLFSEFSKKWDFWMIDEFQDTSPIQIMLLNALIGSSRAFFVGDPQQSIYYFRGSDAKVFESKFQELSKSGFVEVLANNYRSHSGVLSFVNDFFDLQYRQFQRMTITKSKVELVSDVSVYEIEDKKQMAHFVARQIKKIVDKDANIKLEDIVILSRTNKDLNDLASQLEALGVPHYLHSQGKFFKQREVLDILFLARFFIDPSDLNNLGFLLKTPSLGLSNEELKSALTSFRSWEQLVREKDRFSGRIAGSISCLNNYLLKSYELGLSESIGAFVVNEASFVLAYQSDSSGKKESNIWKVLYWIRSELEKGLESFLSQLQLVLNPNTNDDYEESESQAILEPKKIQMMTIHASKGLQFNHVILIGAHHSPRTRPRFSLDVDPVSRKFCVFMKNESKEDKIRSPIHWQQSAIQKESEAEEYERLLYVALTRAKCEISIFTLSKFSENTWAKRFSEFYSHYQQHKESLGFKMNWEILVPSEDKIMNSTQPIEANVSSRQEGDHVTLFLKKMDSLVENNSKPGPISFSSSKVLREVNLHQILITQRGINIHQMREKGILDFSYYSKLDYSESLSEIFLAGFKEYRFTFLYGEFQFVGSIDFVYFGADRILIIDYKSGKSTHDHLYEQQLIFYAQSLSFIKKLSPNLEFDLLIDYVDQKKVRHSKYTAKTASEYFDAFLQKRELDSEWQN